MAGLLTGDPTATAEDGVRWVRALVAELRIPGLRTYGASPAHAPTLVEAAAHSSSMKANHLPLTPDELTEVLLQSL